MRIVCNLNIRIGICFILIIRVNLICWSQSPAPLVVIDEKFETMALVERAFVRHRIHQNERFCPTNVALQVRIFALLAKTTIVAIYLQNRRQHQLYKQKRFFFNNFKCVLSQKKLSLNNMKIFKKYVVWKHCRITM